MAVPFHYDDDTEHVGDLLGCDLGLPGREPELDDRPAPHADHMAWALKLRLNLLEPRDEGCLMRQLILQELGGERRAAHALASASVLVNAASDASSKR